MTPPFDTTAVTEKRLMPFPDVSVVMSRNPHQRGTATLFMESWPAPAPDSPQMPPLTYPAPHVIACSNASILLDLHRGDIDMVIWGRVVPDVWHKALAEPASSRNVFDMCGTREEFADALTSRTLAKEFPPLVLSDAAELSSLFSAVTKDCPQRLRLATMPPEDGTFKAASGALRLVCCYGAANVEWCSYPDPKVGMTNTLDAFAVVFIKGSGGHESGCLHRVCHAKRGGVTSGIHLIIDIFTG
jgi:hypothetical protein